jgi:glycosyltransferase involved in cell wall biosynthesis
MSLPVCVCIPVYNGGPTIRRTLSNLLQQEHRDFQILVYDDGSTDRTAEFVEEIAGRDSRVRLVRGETNMGRGGARNRLLALAGDSLVAWQDADDLWHSTKLSEQLKAREALRDSLADDRFVLISTYSTHKVTRSGPKVKKHTPPEDYGIPYFLGANYRECPFQLQAVIGPAATFLSAGGFDNNLNWAEDVDICFKILRGGFKIVGHPTEQPLAIYNHNLAKARGAVVEAAHAVLVERYREFAAEQGFDIEKVFMRRAANYVAKIYMEHGRFDRALALNLRLLSSLGADEPEQFNQISRMILSIAHESTARFLAANAVAQQSENAGENGPAAPGLVRPLGGGGRPQTRRMGRPAPISKDAAEGSSAKG